MSKEAQESMDSESANPSALAAAKVSELSSEYIDLPHGKELDEEAARDLAERGPLRLIVIAGPVSCGKTTLLLSIYELFLAGVMPGWIFAGSRTLVGFEQRCHPSRINSGLESAHTERTLTNREDGTRYLHLQLVRERCPAEPIEFLFTDLTGEIFESACNSTDDCLDLHFASRADHFVLVLDGKKVASKMSRYAVVQEGETLLRSMLDSGVLGVHSYVTVIFAKSDHFCGENCDADGEAFRGNAIRNMQLAFEKRLGCLLFSEVAARPKSGKNVDFGHGLPALLDRWADCTPRLRPMKLARCPDGGKRESELFFHRYFDSHQ